jgi:hypothetical protein
MVNTTQSNSVEFVLLELLQEVQSLKGQLSASEQQRYQEWQQFQAELNRLATQQQQLIENLHNSPSDPAALGAYLKSQQQHYQDLQQQQEIIRKNQMASASHHDSLNKWLRQELGSSKSEARGSLVGNLGLLGWMRLGVGFLLLTIMAISIQQYLPIGHRNLLKLIDEKIYIIWRDQKATQKFLRMPQEE